MILKPPESLMRQTCSVCLQRCTTVACLRPLNVSGGASLVNRLGHPTSKFPCQLGWQSKHLESDQRTSTHLVGPRPLSPFVPLSPGRTLSNPSQRFCAKGPIEMSANGTLAGTASTSSLPRRRPSLDPRPVNSYRTARGAAAGAREVPARACRGSLCRRAVREPARSFTRWPTGETCEPATFRRARQPRGAAGPTAVRPPYPQAVEHCAASCRGSALRRARARPAWSAAGARAPRRQRNRILPLHARFATEG